MTSSHPRVQVHVAQDIRCGIFSCDSDLEDHCLQLRLQTMCRTRCLGDSGGAAWAGTYCLEPAWICDRQQHLHARQHRAWSPWWGGRQETQVQGQRGLYNETLVQETKTVAETHCPSSLCLEFRLAGQVRSPGPMMRRSQRCDTSDVPQQDSART